MDNLLRKHAGSDNINKYNRRLISKSRLFQYVFDFWKFLHRNS